MYDGIEIDMLSLGDADCILVSFWSGLSAYRILIDGGNKGDAPIIREFLRRRNITTIDAVLSTHLHDDHSGGLVELLSDRTLSFGKLWCNVPHWHVPSRDMNKVWAALRNAGTSDEAARIQKSLETVATLFNTAKERSIAHEEPFSGSRIGNLVVCSPTEDFYAGLVAEFADVEKIKAEDAARERYDSRTALEEKLSKAISGDASLGSSLLPDPHTSPENESSVVTGAVHGGKVALFTADAGTCALTNVTRDYSVAGIHWMQIPHHGSRRNLTEALIKTFSPKVAFVSAIGNDKHPRKAVVNAFKRLDTAVYSTHYPNPANLRHYFGTVPERAEYSAATSLWNAKVLANVG